METFTSTSPYQLLSVGIGAWAFWRIFLRRFLIKDPLSSIAGPPSDSWLFGSMAKVFDPRGSDYRDGLFKTYGRVYRLTGLFQENMLMVSDPKALYHMLIKEQDNFEETEDNIRTTTQVWGMSLLSTVGEHHRKQRKMLNPVFSAAHMRDMVPTFYRIVHKVESSIGQLVGNEEKEIDLLSWMTRTALELVAQSGLGYTFDTLEPDAQEHPYAASVRNWVGTINDPILTVVRMLVWPWVYGIGSPRFQRAVLNAIPWKKLHEIRDMVDIMHNTSLAVFENAKRGLKEGDNSEKIAEGKDIMSALIKANMSASEEDRLPDDELIAQVSTLTFAAMDTTSNAMSRILYLLSENPDVQDRLRQEVTEAYAEQGGDLDYEGLNALPFLDAVCRETLRVYAPGPFVMRQAVNDSILPLSTPIITTDGREITEVPIAKGTLFFVSLHDCNIDPLLWGPDAKEWKPERWLSPLPSTVTEARVPGVYANLMTFLGGGRACIGFKFSQLEMKIVLSLLVKKFKFAPSGKKIIWLSQGILQPAVEDAKASSATGKPELKLPLKLTSISP